MIVLLRLPLKYPTSTSMMSREVAASSSIEYCSHVILARSKVSCACIVGICANKNKVLVRSRRSFTVTSIGLHDDRLGLANILMQTVMVRGGHVHCGRF